MVIIALLNSLKHIYKNSNFYKEARIVSFVDRLLETIKAKLKSKFSLQLSIMDGMKEYETFTQTIESGKNIISKFMENFFIAKLMEDQSRMKDFDPNYKAEETK